MKEPNQKRIAKLVRELLLELGEDPGREGLKKTPARVAKSLAYLTRGYRQNVKTVVVRKEPFPRTSSGKIKV